MTVLHAGGKFGQGGYKVSGGLHGVGASVVNALSVCMRVDSMREGNIYSQTYSRGKITSDVTVIGKCGDRTGTRVIFTPDPEIFDDTVFSFEVLSQRMREMAFLNKGLSISLSDEREGQQKKEVYHYDGGIREYVDFQNANKTPIHPDIIYFEGSRESQKEVERETTETDESGKEVRKSVRETITVLSECEIAMQWTDSYTETTLSYANNINTVEGGSHLMGFKAALTRAINDYGRNSKLLKEKDEALTGDDIREGLTAIISVKLQEPQFEGQTKNKLGSPEIRSELVAQIRDIVADLLHRNPDTAKALIAKIEETQSLRKELQTVKKLSRERSKAVARHIPQLRDCKNHLDPKRKRGRDSMIFLTEGLSAAGSITKTRDVRTQAVFTLRGKPLNVAELQRAAIYTNEELYNLMRALNIEDSTAGLRYEKIVFATDADVDGMHIRNLLLTFFLKFFPSLATTGHVFILETPLFRVRNKKETRYCYSEAERDDAMKSLRSSEVTRFKGLGEINPDEFVHFIGPKMRLTPVRIGNEARVPPVLTFYMGRNTPERRQFIMDHLEVDPEF
jgi:DNA gyrase subunit B